MDAETLYRAADIVVGILLSALRRHQLRSFGYIHKSLLQTLLTLDSMTHPTCTTSIMSKKNIILLLETQQQLARVEVPGIRDFSDTHLTDYLPKSLRFHQLRDITFQISTRNASEGINSFIVQKSPSLNSIALRFLAQGEEPPLCIFTTPTRAPSSRLVLFTLATKLTISGYNFKNISMSSIVPTFPALRALAVVGCKNDWYFHYRVLPEKLPKLQALMFTVTDDISGHQLSRFIGGLRSLRELIVYGDYVYFHDSSTLILHAETLEILSMHRKTFESVFIWGGDASACLSNLTALRHLSIPIWVIECDLISGVDEFDKPELTKIFVCPVPQIHMRHVD